MGRRYGRTLKYKNENYQKNHMSAFRGCKQKIAKTLETYLFIKNFNFENRLKVDGNQTACNNAFFVLRNVL